MKYYFQKTNKLKKDAQALLNNTKIILILSKYGEVNLTGSFVYNLMTWRDIDLCLSVEKPNIGLLLKIGKEIAVIKNISSMYFVNEYTKRKKRNPRAMSWRVKFYTGKKEWKIDILVSTPNVIKKLIRADEKIIKQLTKEKRDYILRIKHELTKLKEYRQKFCAIDIYRAVLQDNISTIKEWYIWRNNHKLKK